eukprot:Skav231485  [mRNA]  locus=scaffold820:330347:334662:+ [translate_table: standard]
MLRNHNRMVARATELGDRADPAVCETHPGLHHRSQGLCHFLELSRGGRCRGHRRRGPGTHALPGPVVALGAAARLSGARAAAVKRRAVKVFMGKGYVEVKRADIDKGAACIKTLEELGPVDFVLCCWDVAVGATKRMGVEFAAVP